MQADAFSNSVAGLGSSALAAVQALGTAGQTFVGSATTALRSFDADALQRFAALPDWMIADLVEGEAAYTEALPVDDDDPNLT